MLSKYLRAEQLADPWGRVERLFAATPIRTQLRGDWPGMGAAGESMLLHSALVFHWSTPVTCSVQWPAPASGAVALTPAEDLVLRTLHLRGDPKAGSPDVACPPEEAGSCLESLHRARMLHSWGRDILRHTAPDLLRQLEQVATREGPPGNGRGLALARFVTTNQEQWGWFG